MKTDTVRVTSAISIARCGNLLCSAFEGGSNYWYMIESFHAPRRFDRHTMSGKIFKHIDYPTNPGGYLVLSASCDGEAYLHNGDSKWRLDIAALQRGLQVMHDKYPSHYADFLAENDDAITGDVFLQCCLFGETVFG